MVYTEFLKSVTESIEKMGFEIEIRKFPHGGDAVVIRSDIDDRYSPVIYPQYYYDHYDLKNYDNEKMIIGMIKDDLRHNFELLKENMPEPSELLDYGKAINHIIPKFISKETAESCYPDEIVKIPYLDFYITFIYIIAKEKSQIISYTVNKDMFSNYKVDEHQLLEDAIKTDESLMKIDIEQIEDALGLEPDPRSSFTVVTNTSRMFGAAVILYKDVLKNYAERIGSSFSIIPSSIHEMLLIPDSMKIPVNELQDMLLDVNSTLVKPSEILGSHIYRYDMDTEKLSIA